MRSFFTFIFLSSVIFFLSGCGSEAAENVNQNAAIVETANVNTAAPAASEPVPTFNDAETALAEGNKYFEASETEKAIDAYKQAVQLNPEFAEAYFRLGVAYSLLEKEEEANRLPGEVTEEPTPKTKKGKKSEPEKTNADKAFENAVKIYKKIVKENPKDDAAFFNLGRSYSKLEEDDEAVKALREAVKLNPENGEYQTELAEALMNTADYDQAIRALKKALQIDENNLLAEELLEKAQAGQKRIEFSKKQIEQNLEQQQQQQERASSKNPRQKPSADTEDNPAENKPKTETPQKDNVKKEPSNKPV